MSIKSSIRRRLLHKAIVAAMALTPVLWGPRIASAENVTDVVLSSGSFQIPFNIASSGSVPREVQLYMAGGGQAMFASSHGESTNLSNLAAPKSDSPGQWRLLDRQSPGVGQFQVSETPEGTFWFATRTIDASGNPHPPGPIAAELKVTIDTSQPVVQLVADADADGKVNAEFTVHDATGADQMTVHYVTDTTRKWQTAPIARTNQGGRFTFSPPDQWQQLSLRLRVLDRAGNETIIKKRVQKPRVASKGSTRFASSPSHPPFSSATPYTQLNQYTQSNQFVQPNQSGTPTQPSQGYNSPFQFGRTSPSATNQRFAADASTLPPPATPQQLSQNFGGLPFDPAGSSNDASMLGGERQGLPSGERQGLPGIELLPDSLPTSMSPSNSNEFQPPAVNPPAAKPQTPAEAMRPLQMPLDYGFNSPTVAEPSEVLPPADSNGPAPETSFQAETIPPPTPKSDGPTTLNRPAIENDTVFDKQNQNANPSVNSTWSPIDSTHARASTENRYFDRRDSGRAGDRSSVQSSGTTSALPSHSSHRLSLDELSKRSVVRHSDSRQFSLDFEIEAIGGRGVEAIELYGTTDAGQTWKRWGDDPDRASPFDIETNSEGVFGFNIVVVAANGLASPRPLSGDVPDIVVVVDETKPEVTLSGARYGEGDRAGSLVIQYRCEDDYLMSRPITLAFSDTPEGPWTTIAAGLRNLGDYVWPADPQLPRQIYLRIDGTDQAGNVGGYVLDEPIDTRGLAPRARIRAFRSIPTP